MLLEAMAENQVFNFVYSSSATVYGDPVSLPITEDHPTGNCTNPYGKSKYFTEEILKDLCASDKVRFKIIFKNKNYIYCICSAGMSFHCVISILWAHTSPVASVKIQMASLTT